MFFFVLRGRRRQTSNPLYSHVSVVAQFLIASVRGCVLCGESGTDDNNIMYLPVLVIQKTIRDDKNTVCLHGSVDDNHC